MKAYGSDRARSRSTHSKSSERPRYKATIDGYSSNPLPPYAGNNVPMDAEGRYPNHVKNYPSRHHDNDSRGFQRQRREEYGKTYNRH
ncbi:unnamed protein product [Brassica oleracea]|uniref:Uncharacterized protein n=1 Tax=Brassica oleracea TaxID=3712 RepID=A0A3P6GXA7_BRAOL|nr:unnamed protein product [Brassica oleracea]